MAIEVQNLLIFLAFVSGAVTEIVEQVKKQIVLFVFNGAETLTSQQQAQLNVMLLLVRFVAGFAGIIILGGYATLSRLLPFFASLPELGVLIIAALIIGLGSSTIYVLLTFVKSLGAWFDQPQKT